MLEYWLFFWGGSDKLLLIIVTLFILYTIYYFMEVAKVPEVRGDGEHGRLVRTLPSARRRYWPPPGLHGGHVQTLLAPPLRALTVPRVRWARQAVRAPDGGLLALDWAEPTPSEPRGVLLVLPGLAGTSRADYARALAAAASELQLACCVIVQRGLGGLPLLTPRLYCALSTADVAAGATAASARTPGLPLLAAGVSLGGIILVNYLLEYGERSLFAGAFVVSSPLDVEKNAATLQHGAGRLWSRLMAARLASCVRGHATLRSAWARVTAARSLHEFDDVFTAPAFGFPSAVAYYRAASCGDRLEQARTPALLLAARDDPLAPVAPHASPRHTLMLAARGGHIAFLEAALARQPYYARVAREYFAALLARPDLQHVAPAADPIDRYDNGDVLAHDKEDVIVHDNGDIIAHDKADAIENDTLTHVKKDAAAQQL